MESEKKKKQISFFVQSRCFASSSLCVLLIVVPIKNHGKSDRRLVCIKRTETLRCRFYVHLVDSQA